MIGIYKISTNIDERVYVGKSINIFKRWSDHEAMLRNNNHHSSKLQALYNNADIKLNFEVLETMDDESKLDLREEYWAREFDSIENGLNVAVIGSLGRREKKPITDHQIVKEPKKPDFKYNLINIKNFNDLSCEFKDLVCNMGSQIYVQGKISKKEQFELEITKFLSENYEILKTLNNFFGILIKEEEDGSSFGIFINFTVQLEVKNKGNKGMSVIPIEFLFYNNASAYEMENFKCMNNFNVFEEQVRHKPFEKMEYLKSEKRLLNIGYPPITASLAFSFILLLTNQHNNKLNENNNE